MEARSASHPSANFGLRLFGDVRVVHYEDAHDFGGKMNIETGLWLSWCVLCAYFVRWTIVRLLRPQLGSASFLVAYAAWVLFFLIGVVIYVWSGQGIKGKPTSDDGVKFLAYLICIWSPLGLPIVVGAGPVLLWDSLVAVGTAVKRFVRR